MSFPKHHRRSIRLKDYDYRQDGAYFITICTFRRQCIFGNIEGDDMFLNTLGCIVETEWCKTADVRPYVVLDEYVVMPNYFHGILFIDYGLVGQTGGLPLPKNVNLVNLFHILYHPSCGNSNPLSPNKSIAP